MNEVFLKQLNLWDSQHCTLEFVGKNIFTTMPILCVQWPMKCPNIKLCSSKKFTLKNANACLLHLLFFQNYISEYQSFQIFSFTNFIYQTFWPFRHSDYLFLHCVLQDYGLNSYSKYFCHSVFILRNQDFPQSERLCR